MPSTDELRTERLRLRRATMADLPAIHDLLSNPLAMRYWSTPPHDSLEESETWLRSMVDADPAVSDDFIVEMEGRLVGKLGCFELPEIGFLFDPAIWGRGVASEALSAFVTRRRKLGTPPVLTADVDPRNQSSLKLLSRAGFRETGRAQRTWQVGDEWCDSVYFALPLSDAA